MKPKQSCSEFPAALLAQSVREAQRVPLLLQVHARAFCSTWHEPMREGEKEPKLYRITGLNGLVVFSSESPPVVLERTKIARKAQIILEN
jgi:hypothetical protein